MAATRRNNQKNTNVKVAQKKIKFTLKQQKKNKNMSVARIVENVDEKILKHCNAEEIRRQGAGARDANPRGGNVADRCNTKVKK